MYFLIMEVAVMNNAHFKELLLESLEIRSLNESERDYILLALELLDENQKLKRAILQTTLCGASVIVATIFSMRYYIGKFK